MSLLPPRLRRLWIPPPNAPSCSLQPWTAISALQARTDLSQQQPPAALVDFLNPEKAKEAAAAALASGSPPPTNPANELPRTLMKHVTMHPVLPWVAYVVVMDPATMEPASGGGGGAAGGNPNAGLSASTRSSTHGSSTTTHQYTHVTLVVQHLERGEILWHASWVDVAAVLYGEDNASKLPSACKSLGTIQSLQFWDSHVLYWSGMMTHVPNNNNTSQDNSNCLLLVQTSNRCLVLCVHQNRCGSAVLPAASRRVTRPALIRQHVSEQSLGGGALPTSNLLGISSSHYLVGCADGSLKCFTTTGNQVIKSIKGLGKGDWIVKILSANSYHATTTAFAANATTNAEGTAASESADNTSSIKRILTCTKKRSLYLIEVEVRQDPSFGLEIRPPLARFCLDTDKNDKNALNLLSVQYDAHRDWIICDTVNTVWVWNLELLQTDLMKSTSKSVLKPDPTLTIHMLAEATAVSPHVYHGAFSSHVVVCGACTSTGDLLLQAATANPNNAVSTTLATPVQVVNLSQLVQQATGLEHAPQVKVFDCVTQPLGGICSTGSGCGQLLLNTNLGLLWLEWPSSTASTGIAARHWHLGAGLGSLGKSVLQITHSNLEYAILDVLKANPVGTMTAKNKVTVYESSPALQFADVHKRPFRLVPLFLPSPSGVFVCMWWPSEYRYEILHVATLLQHVGQRDATNLALRAKPAVARGVAMLSFAWVGDSDCFAVLHAPDVMERQALRVAELTAAAAAATASAMGKFGGGDAGTGGLNLAKDLRSSTLAFTNLATTVTASTIGVTKAATSATIGVTKAATIATVGVTKAATLTTLGVTKTAATVTAKGVTKGAKKSLGLLGFKKKKHDDDKSSSIMADDATEDTLASEQFTAEQLQAQATQALEAIQAAEAAASAAGNVPKRRYVELFQLVAVESQASPELSSTIAAATAKSLGELKLRGGNQKLPTVLFGGPVLCVASCAEDELDTAATSGQAHFYTPKEPNGVDASSYSSSGPTLPYPHLVAWDDDGCLCAVVVNAPNARVAIYYCDAPQFVLLGTVRIGGGAWANAELTSIKFIHGTLFCCTNHSVHAVFLGDLTAQGGICNADSFTIASALVPSIPDLVATAAVLDTNYNATTATNNNFTIGLSKFSNALTPPCIPLPLVAPHVLGYQSGSLVVSTLRGIQAIPLVHPTLRIGTLLAAGQIDRATKWFHAIPDVHHENLASFLERRGHSELALHCGILTGLSLETIVDMSMKYGHVGRLEEVVEEYGVKGLRAMDMGRGVTNSLITGGEHTPSAVVCVGAYLLAQGRLERVRQLATELLRLEHGGKKDALLLASLLLASSQGGDLESSDAHRVLKRAVEESSNSSQQQQWLVGDYVRKHVL